MQESSIGIRVSVECSTTTIAQQRAGFDRVFGHYAITTGDGLTVRWGLVYRILRRSLRRSRSRNPDIDWRRAPSCSRNRCWEACITSIRLQPHRRARKGLTQNSPKAAERLFLRRTALQPNKVSPSRRRGWESLTRL